MADSSTPPEKPPLPVTRATDAYDTVLGWIAFGHHPHFPHILFNEREVESAQKIRDSFLIRESDAHQSSSVYNKDGRKMRPLFDISNKDTLNHSGALFYIAAHEVKHASLAYNNFKGRTNIHTFRNGIKNTSDCLTKTALGINRLFLKTAREFDATPDIKNLALLGITTLGLLTAKPLTVLARMGLMAVEFRLLRHEEKICDKFAIKTVPDVNLDDVERFFSDIAMRNKLREHPRGTWFPDVKSNWLIRAFEDNFCRSHPHEEKRMAYMRAYQKNCRRPPE